MTIPEQQPGKGHTLISNSCKTSFILKAFNQPRPPFPLTISNHKPLWADCNAFLIMMLSVLPHSQLSHPQLLYFRFEIHHLYFSDLQTSENKITLVCAKYQTISEYHLSKNYVLLESWFAQRTFEIAIRMLAWEYSKSSYFFPKTWNP